MKANSIGPNPATCYATKSGTLARRLIAALMLAAPAFLGGCAEYSWLNPVLVWQEWPEDERYVVPFHRRLDEVRRIGDAADRYSPTEQVRLSDQLVSIIREDRNALMRATATRAIGRFPSSLAGEGIALAMADEDWTVRVAATEACRWQADDSGRQQLIALLGDENLDVQIAAIRQLGDFPHATTLTALGEFLDHNDPAVQVEAVEALRTASGRDYGNDLSLWRSFVRGENPPLPEKGSLVSRARDLF